VRFRSDVGLPALGGCRLRSDFCSAETAVAVAGPFWGLRRLRPPRLPRRRLGLAAPSPVVSGSAAGGVLGAAVTAAAGASGGAASAACCCCCFLRNQGRGK